METKKNTQKQFGIYGEKNKEKNEFFTSSYFTKYTETTRKIYQQ